MKTASKLCSALTLSGLVEVKEVCWQNALDDNTQYLCQMIQRESGGSNSPEGEVISVA